MSYRRAPRPLGHVLDRLADELAPDTLLAEVQRRWGEAVGPAIAAAAEPTAERAGVITVACAASVWAQELELMAPQIVARLNSSLTRPGVQRLRCVAVGHGR